MSQRFRLLPVNNPDRRWSTIEAGDAARGAVIDAGFPVGTAKAE